MADTTSANAMDWGSALDSAAQSIGKPLAANPAAFASYYAPIADQVSKNTGIDSNTILGQWGLETGWGKSIIPGTHNLANMKVPQGQQGGVRAVDNQTGSNDAYQQFQTPDDFASAYTDLLKNRYKNALNTGVDAHATAQALKAAGFAEDPNYVSKLTNAASTVAQARGQAPNLTPAKSSDWGSMIDQAMATESGGQNSVAYQPMDKFAQQFPGPGGATAGQGENGFTSFGAGLGRGVQETALGLQSLAGRGLKAVGDMASPPTLSGTITGQPQNGLQRAGQWLINDAAQGNAQGEQDFQAAGGNSFTGKAGRIGGEVTPMLLVPAEIGPMALAGGAQSAGNASLNNQNIAPAFVEGAGLGAAGGAVGHVIGAGVSAARPAIQRALNVVTGGEQRAVGQIADQLGGNVDTAVANMRANATSPIPGVERTAAETADLPEMVRLQRQIQNTPAGQEAFPARAAANNEARFQAGQNVVGPSANNSQMMGPGIEQEAQAFTQAQAQRVAQGMNELPPITQAQADLMQTPAYARSINAARAEAQNAGSDAFATQSRAMNQGLAEAIDQVAGTPATLDAARAARAAAGAEDYAGVAGRVAADSPAYADLEARPGFRTALNRAANIEDNMGGTASAAHPGPYQIEGGGRSLQMNPDGTLGWIEQPGQRTIDASLLQGARARLSGMASKAAQSGDAAEAAGYRDTLTALDNFLGSEQHVGPDIAQAFERARANYATNSVPIDQQMALQQRLGSAVNNLTGEVNPGVLNSAINSVAKDQLKPGLRPADRVTPEQLQSLLGIGQRAQHVSTDMTNLNGQGQEFLRQSLEANASRGSVEAAARDAFNRQLAANSPAYAQMQNVASTYGADLASRQQLAAVLDKLSQAAHNANGMPQMTYSGARAALRQAGPLTGAAQEFGSNLLGDLQRATGANASLGAAGSQTAANLNLGGGLLGDLIGNKLSNHTVGTALATGHFGGAFLSSIGQKLLGSAGVKTEKAAIDLLLNPKKLADALEKFKDQPSSKQAFIEALKAKASTGGKAGFLAVQSYEANH